MIRICHFVIVSILCVLVVSVAAQETTKPKPATRPPTQTIAANCSLRITWDDRVPHVQYDQFILEQPATQKAAKALLNLDDLRRVMSVRRYGGEGIAPNDAGVGLNVGDLSAVEGARPAAAEFADAIIAELPKQLKAYQQSFVSREIDIVRERLALASNDLDRLRAERSDLLRGLRERTGRSDAAKNWAEAIANLEQERQKLTLDLAGQQARRKAIDKTIATTAKRAEETAKEDPIAVEFAKIVELRVVELQRMRQLHEDGRIGQADIADTEAKVADAKARLLERREIASRAAGGEFLGELNRELLMLSINAAENEARLELIQKTLSGFVDAGELVERLELLEKDQINLEEAYLKAKKDVAAMEENFRNLREPKVTVLNCDYTKLDQAPQREGARQKQDQRQQY